MTAEERAEAIARLLALREVAAGLAHAYEDPVSKQGAEGMGASIDRVLQLLGHPE
jgi:hypothetical protein